MSLGTRCSGTSSCPLRFVIKVLAAPATGLTQQLRVERNNTVAAGLMG